MPASINTNIMALNTANTLKGHYSKLATSVHRLSSGLRINSSADDAAGLAIRELMRADIAVSNQGARNANDAISMLQTADGALGVIDEKLIRMKELAEQAATGTYDSTQRLMIASEYQAMADEIDRIARATDFNGIKLLDGSLSGEHDGRGLNSTGRMKIHFGTANDSAEDYYYVEIGDCTTEALGLRGTATIRELEKVWTRVETIVETPKPYNQPESYTRYEDPDTGKTYYKVGDNFCTDFNDPIESLLDPGTDGALIAKLKVNQVSKTAGGTYYVWRDPVTNLDYYARTLFGGTFFSDPNKPSQTTLNKNSTQDKEIIDRLIDTGGKLAINIKWLCYTDDTGKEWFSCDDGFSYVPDTSAPDSNVLFSNNPAHQAKIATIKPQEQTTLFSKPTETVVYKQYSSRVPYYKTYYSRDDGKTFVSNTSKPDETRLDPVLDKDIIAAMTPIYDQTKHNGKVYKTYTNGKGRYYSADDGATFVRNVDNPDASALDPADPYDAAIIAALTPVLATSTGSSTYDVYRSTINNQLYYTGDGGQTYFMDLADTTGTRVDKNDPGYAALTASFIQLSYTASHIDTFELYRDPVTRAAYYTKDKGQTFITDLKQAHKITLDSANPDDLQLIGSLEGVVVTNQPVSYYDVYIDPQTSQEYYTLANGDRSLFVSGFLGTPTELRADDPDDRIIIDRLERKQLTINGREIREFPEVYYVYEDGRNGKIYYQWGDNNSFSSSPNAPYNTKLDPAKPADKAILDNLRPVTVSATKVEYIQQIVGEKEKTVSIADISTQQSAQMALVAIDRAIVQKDKIRAHIGALQNRLENTISNLTIQSENLQAAESRISDTDVSREMTQFVRNQILTQSAVAMLGQANSYPHLLISLLNR